MQMQRNARIKSKAPRCSFLCNDCELNLRTSIPRFEDPTYNDSRAQA